MQRSWWRGEGQGGAIVLQCHGDEYVLVIMIRMAIIINYDDDEDDYDDKKKDARTFMERQSLNVFCRVFTYLDIINIMVDQ